MTISQRLLESLANAPFISLGTAISSILITYLLYNIYFHPLSHIPGPLHTALSPLWLWHRAYTGTEASAIHALHARYGPVVRIAPNDVSISDGAAAHRIYVERGGFLKPRYYANFDIDGFASIFSALDPAHRAPRAKAVVGLFAQGAIKRQGQDGLRRCADMLVERLREMKGRGGGDVLALARCWAVDSLSGYLFGRRYGGLDERVGDAAKKPSLSAAPFVDTFVAVGRFFLLPHALFVLLEMTLPRLFPDRAVDDSMAAIDSYCTRIVSDAAAALEAEGEDVPDTYQARLLKGGMSREETVAQCKDLMFAGTDSTSTNLATILWHLVQQPQTYARLRNEIRQAGPVELVDPQTLPFVRAVVHEGLRVGLANPTRLPRLVPSGGFSCNGHYLPPGAIVGCSSLSLHRDENLFSEPMTFRPERWDDATTEMNRNWFAFGLGSRACIARNLATAELLTAVQHIAASDILDDARPVGESIALVEWFNSKVAGDGIQLAWTAA